MEKLQKIVTFKIRLPKQSGEINEDSTLQEYLDEGWIIKDLKSMLPVGSKVGGPFSNHYVTIHSESVVVVVALLEKES